MKLPLIVYSDPDYLDLCLEFDQAQVPGPDVKFNASLLQDNKFCAFIDYRISDFLTLSTIFLQSNLGGSFPFLGPGAKGSHTSALVNRLLPLKFIDWNLM